MPDNESKPSSIWSDRNARGRYYGEIVAASRPQVTRYGRRWRPDSEAIKRNYLIDRADKTFFDAMREEKLAEREAIADSLDQAGRHEEAALVRSRPAPPEWSAP
jgi:hypothetical protein